MRGPPTAFPPKTITARRQSLSGENVAKNAILVVVLLGLMGVALALRPAVLAIVQPYGFSDFSPVRFPVAGEWVLLGLALVLLVSVTRQRLSHHARRELQGIA